jgi:hypothetical protein
MESKVLKFSMEIPRRDLNSSSIYKSKIFFVHNCQMFFDQTLKWHYQNIFWKFERNPSKDVFYFWARVKNLVLIYGNTKKRFKLFFGLQKQNFFVHNCQMFLDQTLKWHYQNIFWKFVRNPSKDVFYFWARVKNLVNFYGNTKKRFKLFFDLQKQNFFVHNCQMFFDQTLKWHYQNVFWKFVRNPSKDVFYFWATVKNLVLFYGNTKKKLKLFFDLQKKNFFVHNCQMFFDQTRKWHYQNIFWKFERNPSKVVF